MSEWLTIDSPVGWEEIDTKRNAVAFRHPEADIELRVLRIVRPGFRAEDYRVSYLVRCIALQSDSWIDLFETDDRDDLQSRLHQWFNRMSSLMVEADSSTLLQTSLRGL